MKNIFFVVIAAAGIITVADSFLSGVPIIFKGVVNLAIVSCTLFPFFLYDRKKRRKQRDNGGKIQADVKSETREYELFKRLVGYMEENKPYLDDKLDLEGLARAVYTNKVYLSRTINYYAGKNFRRFINSYRISYAVNLMKKDPYLRMEEVAYLSGFHSAVSFNMAFRIEHGKTPTEWVYENRPVS